MSGAWTQGRDSYLSQRQASTVLIAYLPGYCHVPDEPWPQWGIFSGPESRNCSPDPRVPSPTIKALSGPAGSAYWNLVASGPGERTITPATASGTIQGVCEPLEQFWDCTCEQCSEDPLPLAEPKGRETREPAENRERTGCQVTDAAPPAREIEAGSSQHGGHNELPAQNPTAQLAKGRVGLLRVLPHDDIT